MSQQDHQLLLSLGNQRYLIVGKCYLTLYPKSFERYPKQRTLGTRIFCSGDEHMTVRCFICSKIPSTAPERYNVTNTRGHSGVTHDRSRDSSKSKPGI
jgi:hypothetical protein